MPSLVEIAPLVLEKKIFKIRQCFFAISYLSTLEKGCGSSFEQIWIPFTQGVWLNWPNGSGEEDFLISSIYFRYFIIISPWKRSGPNPLHPKIICNKFGWYWPSGYGEEDFYNLSMYFSQFRNYRLLEKDDPLFKQTWMPFTQGCIVASLVKIGRLVLEKKIFVIISLRKLRGPLFEKT